MASVADSLRRQATAAKARLHRIAVNSMVLAAQRIIMASPVGNPDLWERPRSGYVGGRFRANWMFGIGAIDPDTGASPDASGMASMQRVQTGAASMQMGQVAFISNALPYAMALEYGHSTQAPAGMVRTTLADWPLIVREAMAGAQ